METHARILVADDQADILDALELLLRPQGYQVHTARSPDEVVEKLRGDSFDVLLMDLNYARGITTGQEGMDLLRRIESIDRALPVVVMTAWSSVQVAVESMRGRLRDFVQKPWENNQLLATLEEQVKRGRGLRTQARERDEAREIQQGLLPKTLPEIPGYRLASAWRPARSVGGDYFDVVQLEDGGLALCIADVVGKGLPAALLMSNLQATLRVFAHSGATPRELCEKTNRVLCGNLAANKFISFFYAELDPAAGRLTYVNAGHNPPLHVSAAGEVHPLQAGGLPLGVEEDQPYSEDRIELQPDDSVLLYTDGLTEAENEAGKEFGAERLAGLLGACRQKPAEEALEHIIAAVVAFNSGPLRDDASALLLRREKGT